MEDLSSIARELRAARENLKLSREQLAEKINYTASYIEKLETGKLPVTDGYLSTAIPVLIDGVDPASLLKRLRDDERREVVPRWFRPWVEHEQEATEIRWYEPLLVPGLLQTEAYAKALLGDAERVTFRMSRQQVLDRAAVAAIIAEPVLTYRVGTSETMYDQLVKLTESQAVVQLLPTDAETYLGTLGSFALGTVDGAEVAYADSPVPRPAVAEASVVSECRRRWDVLRGEAFNRRQSRDLILKVAERWKSAD